MTTPTTRPLRVLLVDAHPAVRDALALLLAPAEIHICAQADDCVAALRALQHATPDVAVVDLSLGCRAALTLLAELDVRGVPALAYSVHEDGEEVRHALVAGARGYITKREMHRVLIEAIREVAAGREYLGPRAAAALAARLGRMGTHGVWELTGREHEVYLLLGQGVSTSRIADALHVSVGTVESCCARMMRKLGVEGMRPLRRQAERDARNHRA